MARTPAPPEDDFTERIVDIDVSSEMQTSFLEYAYSVIYSRALPDARDGLKPVPRRILYSMDEMGVRPDRTHVKCARVVGEVMGKYHPHGDGAIYDALVRTAQPWTMRLALIDGHGNFGSPDDGPAAMRYTECRMAAAALAMTAGLDQDTVDFKPNYDGKDVEPVVLPAAFPNLLVNGASGIAVGMATNCPPHNLVEVVQALRHLISHPDAGVEELMRFIPGPDLPTGGKIIGLDGIREAYTGGRGSFRIRATARIEQVHPRRKGIVITELPYPVGPERVIEQIKAGVNARRLQGIADVKDLSDRTNGTRLVIEVKNGFNPEALLEQLYKVTKMEDTFGINAVALVDGQPRTLDLRDLLTVYLEHRYEVTRRRTAFARSRATDRLHLVEGLLVAILDIDDVIAIIRSTDEVQQARTGVRTRQAASHHRRADRNLGQPRPAPSAGRQRIGRDGAAARDPAAHNSAGCQRRRDDGHDRAVGSHRRPLLGPPLLRGASRPNRPCRSAASRWIAGQPRRPHLQGHHHGSWRVRLGDQRRTVAQDQCP